MEPVIVKFEAVVLVCRRVSSFIETVGLLPMQIFTKRRMRFSETYLGTHSCLQSAGGFLFFSNLKSFLDVFTAQLYNISTRRTYTVK